MATTIPSPVRRHQDSTSSRPHGVVRRALRRVSRISWLILAAGILLLNVFTHQVALVPQLGDYHANWHGAQWIGVPNTDQPVEFFRKDIALEAAPEDAFLTMQGDQYYTVFVNGVFLDSNSHDFKSGVVYDTNIYDVAALLQPGENVIAIQATNQDVGAAQIRAVLGINYGDHLQVYPSDRTWKATNDASLTSTPTIGGAPSQTTVSGTLIQWTTTTFNDSAWPSAAIMAAAPVPDGTIPFDPVTFETPMPHSWVTAGPHPGAFYYQTLSLPAFSHVWLRVASTGTADVYINGNEAISQPAQLQLDQTGTSPPWPIVYTAGVYDITPYVSSGRINLGVHVASAGINLTTFDQTQPAAMVFDLIVIGQDGSMQELSSTGGWLTSATSAPDWTIGSNLAGWQPGTVVNQSSITSVSPYKIADAGVEAVASEAGTNYQSPQLLETSARDTLAVAAFTTLAVLLFGALAVLLSCLGAWSVRRVAASVDGVALALLPGTALLALLLVLNHYPMIPDPFPFTLLWIVIFCVLSLCALAAAVVIVRRRDGRDVGEKMPADALRPGTGWRAIPPGTWAIGAAVVALLALGAFMVTYNLGYESFWQDELASINAATGVLHHGVPVWSTGFLYTKSELFSYMLAVVIAVFGYNPVALRMFSAIEYLIMLCMTFVVGRYFFGKRVGLLALALAVFNPLVLHWGREARMYQQAQLMVLVVVFLFYKALEPGARTRYIYLSMAAVVVMYLTHEETFILLPAMLIYFLVTRRLTWVRNRHWWIGGLGAIACILAQLAIWRLTRRPVLGTDRTVLFLLHYSPENINWYLQLFINPKSLSLAELDSFAVIMGLAVIAVLIAIFRRDRALRYVSTMTFVPLGVLMVSIPLYNDRYADLLLPLLFILASVVIVRFLSACARLARQRLSPAGAMAIVTLAAVLVCSTVIASEISSLNNLGLAASRVLGFQYHHFHPDYQRAGDYILSHWEPGDILISSAPESDAAFYAKGPDYYVYQDKALSLYEHDGEVSTNSTGATPIFNLSDLRTVLAGHHRVWLLTSSGHQPFLGSFQYGILGIGPFYQNFQLVFEGQNTWVYLYTG